MAKLVSDVLASARYTLNDAPKRRLPDTEGCSYVADGLNAIRNLRPDLFLGNWAATETVTLTTPLPVSAQFFRPLVDYVIARTDTKDVESAAAARAQLLLQLAGGYLT